MRGFTLVELSIVLVILGLLVGGVLAGQSLIRAAELRAVTTEYNSYKTALSSFKDKYFAIPGDMPNAVRYWGFQTGNADDGVNSACAALTDTTPSIDQRTCNGDGNGLIGDVFASVHLHELTRSWQHLANAGLVSGQYTGVRGPLTSSHAILGQNVPQSRFSGGGWHLLSYPGPERSLSAIYPLNYGNTLILGAASPTSVPLNPLLTPQEAYQVDTKMDDGKPNTGSISTYKYNNSFTPRCVTSSNTEYDLSLDTPQCHLIFITGY